MKSTGTQVKTVAQTSQRYIDNVLVLQTLSHLQSDALYAQGQPILAI